MTDRASKQVTGDVSGSPVAKTDPRVKPQQRGRPQQRANKNAVAIPLLPQKTSPSVPTPPKPSRDTYPCEPPPPTPSSEEIITINVRGRTLSSGQIHHTIRRLTDLEVSSKPESLSGTSTLVYSPSVPLYNREDDSIAPITGVSGGVWLVHKSLIKRVPEVHQEDWARHMPMTMSPLNLNASPWVAPMPQADGNREHDDFRPDDGTVYPNVDAGWNAVATSDTWSGSQRVGPGSGTSFIDGNWGWATDAQDVPALDSATNATLDDTVGPNSSEAYDLGSPTPLDLQQSNNDGNAVAMAALPKSSQDVFQQLEMQLVDPGIEISNLATLLQASSLTRGQLLHLLGHLRTQLLDTLFQIRTIELHFARLSYFGPKYTNRIEAAGKRFQNAASVEFYDSMDEDFVAQQAKSGGNLDVRVVILQHAEAFRGAIARLAELRGHDERSGPHETGKEDGEISEKPKKNQTRGGKKQKSTKLRGRQKRDVVATEVAALEASQHDVTMRPAIIEKNEATEAEHALSAPASVGSLLRQGQRGVSVPALR